MSASSGLTTGASIPLAYPASESSLNPHCVHFYEDDSFLLDSLTKLIGTALVAGDAAIVIATPEHCNALARRLKARGLDLDLAAQRGKYSAFDAAATLSTFMVHDAPDDGLFDAFMGHVLSSVRSATKGESPNLVLFGEMVSLLCADGNFDAALKLERLWNDLARKHSFHLHCAYPMNGFDREGHSQTFLNICAEHSHVVPTENYTSLASEDDRLRHISLLQQRAQATEVEAAGRLRAEEALRRSERTAGAGRLAASIAHEINNPLEAICNAIYLARSSPSDVLTYLKIADQELARVAQITRQTLGYYRESASPGIVKVSALLDDLLVTYSGKLHAKDLSVTKDYRGELEIWGIEGELRQVFANQFANAIYAMPQHGRLTIRIRKSKSWNNGQRPGTVVSMADTGSGIPQEFLTRIFDLFFTTKQDVGNGLGLWITHDIVTRHGGNIRVRSTTRPGTSGTIFSTFLPHHDGNTPALL